MAMTLAEKIALCSGADFWHTKDYTEHGIPPMMMCDGPNGLRRQADEADMLGVNESMPATCFPTEALTACSFDEELLSEIGHAIALEAADQGVGMVLGPGANIKRNPLCGRNFEYFSEDPYLSGKMAAAYIRGVQSTGTVSSLKHFACNSQEYKRFSSDSILDERTLREMYLRAFEIAVKEGKPGAVMSAYNKINGVHCSDNRKLLTDILRTEWGFDGMVVTDWGAMDDRIRSFQAGCDLCMPGGSAFMEKEAEKAVLSGELREEDIDRSVERIRRTVRQGLDAIARLARDESKLSEGKPCPEKTNTVDRNSSAGRNEKLYRQHFDLAARAAQESAVLLKNDKNALPLASLGRTVFIGALAKSPRYQGAGSSHINPWKLESPLEACEGVTYVPGYHEDGSTDEELIREALDAASPAETIVVFAGLPAAYESEGFDREDMKLPEGMNRLIRELSASDKKLIVVLYSGSVVELPWADEVDAILYMGLPGEAGGTALKNLLLGQASPCGKLAESWPVKYEDVVSSECYGHGRKDAEYRESIYVGYRYYVTAHVPVRYPFGHGLTYTEFTYSDLKIEGRDVTCTVTNTGNVPAKEIVQLYLQSPSDLPSGRKIFRPALELAAFCKISLQPGESTGVHFRLDDRSFVVWENGWLIPEGTYTVRIGGSSEDLPLEGTICEKQRRLSICQPQSQEAEGRSVSQTGTTPEWYLHPQGKPSREDFEQLIGRKVKEKPLQKGSFTMDNTVMEMKDSSLVMKVMYKAVRSHIAKGFRGKDIEKDPTFRMMLSSSADASLNSMKISGGMKNYVLEGMLEMANGHVFRGIRRMIHS